MPASPTTPSVPAITLPGGEFAGGGMPPINGPKVESGIPSTGTALKVIEDSSNPHGALESLAANKPTEQLKTESPTDNSIKDSMNTWDSEHPPLNTTDTNSVMKWVTDRNNYEKQITVTTGVKNEMSSWDATHKEPDTNNKELHDKWANDRSEFQKSKTQENEKKYDEARKKKEDEEQGMSAAEFAEKVHQLQALRENATKLFMSINELRLSNFQTQQVSEQLKRCEDTLKQVNAQINVLQAELQLDHSVSTGQKKLIKSLLLPAIIAAGVIAMPAMAEMNKENHQ